MKIFSWDYIKDINYSFFYMSGIRELEQLNFWGKRNICYRFLLYFVKTFRNIIADIYYWKKLSLKIDKRVVFFPIAVNNLEPMEGIIQKMNVKYIVLSSTRSLKKGKIIPYSVCYILGLFFLPVVFFNYIKCNNEEKYRLKLFADSIILSYGYTLFWIILTRFKSPSAVFFANDHVFQTRALNYLARRKGIKTFYIQHAPVSKEFPPLAFSTAFLEGHYSAQCYKNNGCKLYFVGNLKFELYRKLVRKTQGIRKIGIATNVVIDNYKMHELIIALKKFFPDLELYYRPHIEKKEILDYKKLNLIFSDMNVESTFSFLSKIDLIISGNSGILLEANLMNVTPIRYLGAEYDIMKKMDGYEISINSACFNIYTQNELIDFIKRNKNNRPVINSKITEWYYANCSRQKFGNIFEFIASKIENEG